MPKNKDALTRYKVINQMLANGKTATKRQLADACADRLNRPISLRTIENDLHAMRYDEGLGYFAPIEYDHANRGYIYSEAGYSIDNLPLDDEDIRNLGLAASLLKQYSGVTAFSEFSGTIDKVIRLINYKKLQSDGNKLDFIEFEKNPTTTGLEFIDQLIPCIRKKKVIHIRHQSFWREDVQEFTVHPFYLKEYRGRWYLVGYCEEREDIRIFGLERILNIETKPLKRFTPKHFNPETYFETFIGINVPEGKPEEVLLRFKNSTGNYILTQPIHHSQQLIRQEGETHDFRYLIAINWEFIGVVLSWQGNVEVLAPAGFRDRIRRILEESIRAY
nr:WYL domain-containing protein [Bacteroidota bacterium]